MGGIFTGSGDLVERKSENIKSIKRTGENEIVSQTSIEPSKKAKVKKVFLALEVLKDQYYGNPPAA